MWDWLLDTSSFMPRAHCGAGWSVGLIFADNLANVLIWAAYLSIPLALFIVRRHLAQGQLRRRHLDFIAFIFLCGMTHFFDALMFYYPVYRLAFIVKALTAVVSVWVAVRLWLELGSAVAFYQLGVETASKLRQLQSENMRELLDRKDAEYDRKVQTILTDLEQYRDRIHGFISRADKKNANAKDE